MEAKDLLGLEKPLVKLIETIGEGLGVMGNNAFQFDAKKLKRIGEAEAEIEKAKIIKKAEGQEEALAILERAGKRFALDQYNKQINLENIIYKSKTYLEGEEVNSRPVDKDWSSRFIAVAQEISKDEIQDLLAKILSEEIKKPDTYSLRTLDVLRNISRNELELFSKFVAISNEVGFFLLDGNGKSEKMNKYNIKFEEFIMLADVGLFNPSSILNVTMDLSNEPRYINIGRRGYAITAVPNVKLTLDTLKFTVVGSQLYPLLLDSANNSQTEKYNKDFILYCQQRNALVNEIKKS